MIIRSDGISNHAEMVQYYVESTRRVSSVGALPSLADGAPLGDTPFHVVWTCRSVCLVVSCPQASHQILLDSPAEGSQTWRLLLLTRSTILCRLATFSRAALHHFLAVSSETCRTDYAGQVSDQPAGVGRGDGGHNLVVGRGNAQRAGHRKLSRNQKCCGVHVIPPAPKWRVPRLTLQRAYRVVGKREGSPTPLPMGKIEFVRHYVEHLMPPPPLQQCTCLGRQWR